MEESNLSAQDWKKEIFEAKQQLDTCKAEIGLSDKSSYIFSDTSLAFSDSKYPKLYQDAIKKKYVQKQKEEEASLKAKAESNSSKMNKTSASLSLKRTQKHVQETLDPFDYILQEDLSPIFRKLFHETIKIDEQFLELVWTFLTPSDLGVRKQTMHKFLVVLMRQLPKEATINSLFEINGDFSKAELITKEFGKLYQEAISYKHNYCTKPNQKIENLPFNPKICRRSAYLDKLGECNRHEHLYGKASEREERAYAQKMKAIEEEMKDCTFAPAIVSKEKRHSSIPVSKRLYNQRNAPKVVQDARTTDEKELELCTFQPKICAKKAVHDQDGPKGYMESIERMRKANKEKEEKKALLEKIPTGENYYKLRNMPQRDFSFMRRSKNQREVNLYVDVNLGGGKSGRIAIHPGDDPKVLARNFAKAFDLSKDMQIGLEELLKEQIANSS